LEGLISTKINGINRERLVLRGEFDVRAGVDCSWKSHSFLWVDYFGEG
jgi:hypothetical protein